MISKKHIFLEALYTTTSITSAEIIECRINRGMCYMPPAVAPIIVGVAVGISAYAAVGVAATAILIAVATTALGYLSYFLSPDPPDLSSLAQRTQKGRTSQFLEPVAERELVYGEVRKSGPLIFVGTTDGGEAGEENRYLHMVIALANHEVEAIDTLWIDDYEITAEMLSDAGGEGATTAGFYTDGRVRVYKLLGAEDQAANTQLVSAFTEWTTDHRLRGVAYIYVRLRFDFPTNAATNKFPRGIPNVSVTLRGKKVYDPRTAQTIYSDNPALCLYDYLTTLEEDGGCGFDSSEINEDFLIAAANICDQYVDVTDYPLELSSVDTTNDLFAVDENNLFFQRGDRVQVTSTGSLPTGISAVTDYYVIPWNAHGERRNGVRFKLATSRDNALASTAIDITGAGSGTITVTKKGEPRYTCNGVVSTSRSPFDNINDMLTSMGGRAIHIGDTWKLYAAAYNTPLLEINENNIRSSGINISTKHSRKDRFNAVKGTFVDSTQLGVVTDYPSVTNATYQAQDLNRRIYAEYDLPFTTRPHTCQRLAKILLERHRQEIQVSCPIDLIGLRYEPNQTLYLTNDKFGWSSKEFEILDWNLIPDEGEGATNVSINLSLLETASGIYDWNSGEETTIDLAPNTNIPSAFTVTTPTGLTIESGTQQLYLKLDGTVVSRMKISWTSNGIGEYVERYLLRYKKTSASTWSSITPIPYGDTEAFIWDVEDGVSYDVELKAQNYLGVYSDPATASHTVLGKSTPPTGVTGFSAQQNGNVVLFKWNQVADLDLAGYEIRYVAR